MFIHTQQYDFILIIGTFNFWMDTIHCYGRVADKNEGLLQSDGTDNLLDPPVIAIGTHKDKFQVFKSTG